LYRQSLIIDSNPEEENEENLEDETLLYQADAFSSFLIEENSDFIVYWNIHIVLLILIILISSPIQLAFFEELSSSQLFLNIYVDFFFICDMILQFFTTFETYEEINVRDFSLIAKNYFFGWFLFDFFISFPISSIVDILYLEDYNVNVKVSALNNSIKFLKIYRLIKFSSILRILKLHKDQSSYKQKYKKENMHLLNELNLSNAYSRLFKFMIGFIAISHIITCLWIFFGKLQHPNWIFKANMQDKDNQHVYIASLYFNWSTIFTIGYGDIVPVNSSEMCYTLVLELFGVMLYSYFISSLGSILLANDDITLRYMKNMDLLTDIKIKYNLDGDISERISRYLNYDYKNNNEIYNNFKYI